MSDSRKRGGSYSDGDRLANFLYLFSKWYSKCIKIFVVVNLIGYALIIGNIFFHDKSDSLPVIIGLPIVGIGTGILSFLIFLRSKIEELDGKV